jgi:hypothetical protein
MKTVPRRTIEVLLSVAILTRAVDLFLILYPAGHLLSWLFVTIKAQNIASPTVLLMDLILSRASIRCCASAAKALSAYVSLLAVAFASIPLRRE